MSACHEERRLSRREFLGVGVAGSLTYRNSFVRPRPPRKQASPQPR